MRHLYLPIILLLLSHWSLAQISYSPSTLCLIPDSTVVATYMGADTLVWYFSESADCSSTNATADWNSLDALSSSDIDASEAGYYAVVDTSQGADTIIACAELNSIAVRQVDLSGIDLEYCVGDVTTPLPTTLADSDGGMVDGTWDPPQVVSPTTSYTFMPAGDERCVRDTILMVSIDPVVDPIDERLLSFCRGDGGGTVAFPSTTDPLISGDWQLNGVDASDISTTSSGEFDYIFIPDGSVNCVAQDTLTVRVIELVPISHSINTLLCRASLNTYMLPLTVGGYSGSWQNSSAMTVTTVDTDGTYSFIPANNPDRDSCANVLSLDFTIVDVVDPIAPERLEFCREQSGSAPFPDAAQAGSWQVLGGSGVSSIPTDVAATTQYEFVPVANCTKLDTLTVVVHPTPSNILLQGGAFNVCGRNGVVPQVMLQGDDVSRFSWQVEADGGVTSGMGQSNTVDERSVDYTGSALVTNQIMITAVFEPVPPSTERCSTSVELDYAVVHPSPTIQSPAQAFFCSGDSLISAPLAIGMSAEATSSSTFWIGEINGSTNVDPPVIVGSALENLMTMDDPRSLQVAVRSTYATSSGDLVCPSDTVRYNYSVRALPTIDMIPDEIAFCSGLSALVPVSSTFDTTLFDWSGGGSIGLADGEGSSVRIPNTINPNVNTSNSEEITITPFTRHDVSPQRCEGEPRTTEVTIHPAAMVNAPVTPDYCEQIQISDPIVFAGSPSGTSYVNTYSWMVVSANSIDGLPPSGMNQIDVFTPVITSADPDASDSVSLEVVPSFEVDGQTCLGDTVAFDISIRPAPFGQINIEGQSDAERCDGMDHTVNFIGGGNRTDLTYQLDGDDRGSLQAGASISEMLPPRVDAYEYRLVEAVNEFGCRTEVSDASARLKVWSNPEPDFNTTVDAGGNMQFLTRYGFFNESLFNDTLGGCINSYLWTFNDPGFPMFNRIVTTCDSSSHAISREFPSGMDRTLEVTLLTTDVNGCREMTAKTYELVPDTNDACQTPTISINGIDVSIGSSPSFCGQNDIVITNSIELADAGESSWILDEYDFLVFDAEGSLVQSTTLRMDSARLNSKSKEYQEIITSGDLLAGEYDVRVSYFDRYQVVSGIPRDSCSRDASFKLIIADQPEIAIDFVMDTVCPGGSSNLVVRVTNDSTNIETGYTLNYIYRDTSRVASTSSDSLIFDLQAGEIITLNNISTSIGACRSEIARSERLAVYDFDDIVIISETNDSVSLCPGDSVMLTNGFSIIRWRNEEGELLSDERSFAVPDSILGERISVSVTSSEGCTDTASVTLIQEEVVTPEISPLFPDCEGSPGLFRIYYLSNITLTDEASVTWSHNGSAIEYNQAPFPNTLVYYVVPYDATEVSVTYSSSTFGDCSGFAALDLTPISEEQGCDALRTIDVVNSTADTSLTMLFCESAEGQCHEWYSVPLGSGVRQGSNLSEDRILRSRDQFLVLGPTSELDQLRQDHFYFLRTWPFEEDCDSGDCGVISYFGFDGRTSGPDDLAMRLSPNPSLGAFTLRIEHEEMGDFQVRLTNSLGQPVLESSLNKTSIFQDYSLQLEVPSGLYFVTIRSPFGRELTEKLIIQ